MDTDLQKKLSDLDKGQDEILRRLDDVGKTVRNVVAEVGGVPDIDFREKDRRTLRWRLHALENDREAVRIAGQAVQAASQARDAAQSARNENAMKKFTKREKIAGLVLAFAIAAGPYISAAFFGH